MAASIGEACRVPYTDEEIARMRQPQVQPETALERRGATDEQKVCPHLSFRAQVNVNRMEDTGRFSADVTVWCAECKLPFEFVGVPSGLDWARPMVSIDGTELRAPIEPQYQVTLRQQSTLSVPPELHGAKH